MLGGRSPKEMAGSDAETKEVERLLYAIASGLLGIDDDTALAWLGPDLIQIR